MRQLSGGIVAAVAAVLVVACASAAPGGTGRTELGLRPVFRGLSSPVYVAAAPGQPRTLYVVEQVGRIRVAPGGKLRPKPFLDIRSKVVSGGEQGLLSMAFHPKYRTNRKYYVNYTDTNGDTRVVEYRGTRALRQILFVDQPYANHNGGQLQFGPDGWLYVGMGDGGSGGDPENRAQNVSARLGKLLRINVNTKRPVVQVAGYGLRNPWRFSFDANGDLYIADVGQSAWEEIDYTPRSSPGLENYGWDVYEGTHQFERKDPSGPGKLVMPIAEYPHSQGCSVTGGYVYRGRAIATLRGRYIYGDFCSGTIWTLRVADGKAEDVRRESISFENLSSFGRDAAGELYATSLDGGVYRITAG
jgi:glucose/arabinose dehydrogenase